MREWVNEPFSYVIQGFTRAFSFTRQMHKDSRLAWTSAIQALYSTVKTKAMATEGRSYFGGLSNVVTLSRPHQNMTANGEPSSFNWLDTDEQQNAWNSGPSVTL